MHLTRTLFIVCFLDKEGNITVRAKPVTITTLDLVDGANWTGVDTAIFETPKTIKRSSSPISREGSSSEAPADTCQVESSLTMSKSAVVF